MWLQNSGAITAGRINYSHFRIDGSGGMSSGYAYEAGDTTIGGSATGIITNLYGFVTGAAFASSTLTSNVRCFFATVTADGRGS